MFSFLSDLSGSDVQHWVIKSLVSFRAGLWEEMSFGQVGYCRAIFSPVEIGGLALAFALPERFSLSKQAQTIPTVDIMCGIWWIMTEIR